MNVTDEIPRSGILFTCYLECCSVRVSIRIQDLEENEQVVVYLFNLLRLEEKWCMSFLIGQFQFKSSWAVAFWFFFFLGVCCVVLHAWWTFYCRISGRNSSFSRIAWESKYDAGRPELARTPRTSSTRQSCTLFKSVTAIHTLTVARITKIL